MSVNNAYKCKQCQSVHTKPASGARTRQPCDECGDITTWEQTDDEIEYQKWMNGRYTEEYLIRQLEYANEEAEGELSGKQLRRYSGVSESPYVRVWGSFQAAKDEIL